jgi:hypothetical protein
MTRSERKTVKELIEKMQQRAFEIRQMTGRGQTREQLLKDTKWSELNREYETLIMK